MLYFKTFAIEFTISSNRTIEKVRIKIYLMYDKIYATYIYEWHNLKKRMWPRILQIFVLMKGFYMLVRTWCPCQVGSPMVSRNRKPLLIDQPIEICNTTRFGFVSICHMKKKANSQNDSGPHWNELGYILMGFLSTEVDILACRSIKLWCEIFLDHFLYHKRK